MDRIGWIVGFVLLFCGGAARAQEAAAPAAATEVEKSQPVDVSGGSQQALARLREIEALLVERALSEQRTDEIAELETTLDTTFGPSDALDAQLNSMSQAQLDDAVGGLAKNEDRLDVHVEELNTLALALEKLSQELRNLSKTWAQVRAEEQDIPEALALRIVSITDGSITLDRRAQDSLNTVAALQNQVLALQGRVTQIRGGLKAHAEIRRSELLRFQHPPLWHLSAATVSETMGHSARAFASRWGQDAASFAAANEINIALHLLALGLILLALRSLKSAADTAGVDTHETRILRQPAASALLLATLAERIFYTGTPSTIALSFGIAAAVLSIVVLRPFLAAELRRTLFALVVLFAVDRILAMAPAAVPVQRVILLVLGVATAIVIATASQRRYTEMMHERGLKRWIVRPMLGAGILLMVAAIILNVFGNADLASLLTSGVIRSLLSLIVVFTLYLILNDLVSLLLRPGFITRVRTIVRNRTRILASVRRPILFLTVLGWFAATAAFFEILEPITDGIRATLNAEAQIGTTTLSLGRLVAFVLAVWLAIVSSRIVRAVLAEDVLPRMALPRGIPNTIGVTVNYAIVLLGLIIGAGFLGIDLSNLGLIVGALGVGIGFGLQNVVNNFVSGLILVFERPVQVGDAVQVGELFGTVTQIGLRASRIRSFSGAEIIVPNGDLISQQVTNWTLSDRRRRLEIPVGVAYKSDAEQVQKILMEVTTADEGVLDDPTPLVIFEEFGDSALQFRIYCWISDFDMGLSIKGRLFTSVNQALKDAGVEIPFPQRDLNLRSIQTDDPLVIGGPDAGSPET